MLFLVCSSGWIYNAANMYCYWLNQNLLSQAAAEAACQLTPFGHLTSIESQAENDFIYSLFLSFCALKMFRLYFIHIRNSSEDNGL